MECHTSESNKLTKVFDASKRCKSRKKGRHCVDHSNSVASDGSTSVSQLNQLVRTSSAEASIESIKQAKKVCNGDARIDGDSSYNLKRSPLPYRRRRSSPSPKYKMNAREETSLALKAGLISTPKSNSQHGEEIETPTPDQDSLLYAFFEEAIKNDKKKQRHCERGREEHVVAASSKGHHYHHRRNNRHRSNSRECRQEKSVSPRKNQEIILETFAKLCSQLTDKKSVEKLSRCLSHKSLQCEVDPVPNCNEATRLRNYEHSNEKIHASRSRSQDTLHRSSQSQDNIQYDVDKRAYDKSWHKKELNDKYSSKADFRPRTCIPEPIRYRDIDVTPTKSRIETTENTYYDKKPSSHVCEKRKDKRPDRYYENNRRFERKTSRSFDLPRHHYVDERCCRVTSRSDNLRDRRSNDYREAKDDRYMAHDDRYMGSRRKSYVVVNQDKRMQKKDSGRYDRDSEVSRDCVFRERHTSRDRDSGYSIADGESIASTKSHYLKVVKQEITEQREAMDNMMKLWKELMRCFKSVSNCQNKNGKQQMHDNANSAKESAAEQFKLWRECMQRYETVARDVGDTDARLMLEINKQRSEMAEMATMWQECLQRYREMSNDFDKLKQQVKNKTVTIETAAPRAMPPQVICADGEGASASYRVPHSYSPPPQQMANPYMGGGSPLRARASVPPWWWCSEPVPEHATRRRSSPDSRPSPERDDRERRHRHKEREETRHKEKSKPAAGARSEHKHRRR